MALALVLKIRFMTKCKGSWARCFILAIFPQPVPTIYTSLECHSPLPELDESISELKKQILDSVVDRLKQHTLPYSEPAVQNIPKMG